jgi:D-amino-acid dehydrogenase
MKICVLGAGVIGLTTAWYLSEAGHDVTIVDRHTATGADASAANGGQLSYAFVTPLASPATLLKLPSLLIEKGSPIRLRPGLDPQLISWGVRFLLACRSAAVRDTVAAQLALAALSRDELARLSHTLALSFGLRTAGKLVLFRSQGEFEAARSAVIGKSGDTQQILTPAECLALEPALKLSANTKSPAVSSRPPSRSEIAAHSALRWPNG